MTHMRKNSFLYEYLFFLLISDIKNKEYIGNMIRLKTIKEIEHILENLQDDNDPILHDLLMDKRKGVQQLVQRWKKKREQERIKQQLFAEMSVYERKLREKGCQWIAGVDEAGRGPLAGPVVAAAVILPEHFYLPGINDSKKLTEQMREKFFNRIMEEAVSVGIGFVSAKEIDNINIYEASKLAMIKAVKQLNPQPEHLLVDALSLPISIPQTSLVKGDAKSFTIAASSIVAKVTRDRYMKRLGEKYPQYGFEHHMGYGTKLHLEAIKEHGVTSEHRKSFSPIQMALSAQKE
jgi:ribonuclease HII